MLYQIYSYSEEFLLQKKNVTRFVVIYSISDSEMKKRLKLFHRTDPNFKPFSELLYKKPNITNYDIDEKNIVWYPCTNEDAIQWYRE